MNKDEHTIQELMLAVSGGHTLYVHDWGNKNADTAIIRLHGGPGSTSADINKRPFDPRKQRVVFFDQRGCGKSVPYGSLRHNTTADLIEDISVIAHTLELNKFVLYGTSWGSTLALAYAVAHPEKVEALIIGGVFTGSRSEIDWLDKGQMKTFWPEVWQNYVQSVPEKHQSDPSGYHFKRILEGNADEQKASGLAYEKLEGGVMFFDDRLRLLNPDTYDPTSIRIEVHYLANGCFMPDRHIFDNAGKLTMPVYIVQGRYDMVCPPKTAYELHQKLPNSQLYWTQSNHAVEHEGDMILRTLFTNVIR